MKKGLIFAFTTFILVLSDCNAGNSSANNNKTISEEMVVQLTNESFKKMIFNYDVNKTWKFEGTKPVIIDFYADWCPPCRQLSPLVEEIAKEYEGKIIVYKVNTDKEKVLTQSLGISSLPTLLYIPAKGKPQVTLGMIPKETIVKNINEILLIK
jgi:thioredoxin 1